MAASNERARTTAGAQATRRWDELATALGASLGELLDGKRVAILGDGSTKLPARCAEASGRRVHVFDPDPRRTAEAIARGTGAGADVRYALLEGDAELGQGAFDAVLVPDLAALTGAGALTPEDALALADRMLNARGFVAVMVRAQSPGLDYHRLFDVVSARFDAVRMLGAAPFVGVTIAEFGERNADEVAFDASLTDSPEAPLAFIAVASRQPLVLEPYLVVQLAADDEPSDVDAVPTTSRADDMTSRAAETARRAAEGRLAEQARMLTAQSTRIAELEAELAAEREAGAERLRRAHADAVKSARRCEEVHQRDLDAVLERIAELEAELADAHDRFAREDASATVERERQAHEFQLAELRKAAAEARDEADSLRALVAKAREDDSSRAALEAELVRTRATLKTLETEEGTNAASEEIAALEARLRERGERVAGLEADLREAERTGKELVRDLTKARAKAAEKPALPAPIEAQALVSDAANKDLAERLTVVTAELEAARWTIAAKERELAERAESAADVARLEAALERAHALATVGTTSGNGSN
jgi:cytochrome c551/c552